MILGRLSLNTFEVIVSSPHLALKLSQLLKLELYMQTKRKLDDAIMSH